MSANNCDAGYRDTNRDAYGYSALRLALSAPTAVESGGDRHVPTL